MSASEWEGKFWSWAKGPSDTEQQKCDNAESAIRKAINASEDLEKLNISVFAQGSYRGRTNIRSDSDVDICIRLNSTFYPEYPSGMSKEDFGNTDGSTTYSEFKNLVQVALETYFGASTVHRGNKAFDVHANTYRVDADVVPTLEHRRYATDKTYQSGVEFQPDGGGRRIINWPQQTYDNGIEKNNSTSRKYKRVIRILKRLRNEMQDSNVTAANGVASFLIECLVWNVPDINFSHEDYFPTLRSVLMHLFNNTMTDEQCGEWGEVNELKYLFRSTQPWSRIQAHNFVSAAWDYMGLK